MKLEFYRQIFEKKKAQISSVVKIRPVGAKLFHAERQTDMMKLIVAFRNFANVPKNSLAHTKITKVSNLISYSGKMY